MLSEQTEEDYFGWIRMLAPGWLDDKADLGKAAMIVKWFDTVGIHIDRDSRTKRYKVYDSTLNHMLVASDYINDMDAWMHEAIAAADEYYKKTRVKGVSAG